MKSEPKYEIINGTKKQKRLENVFTSPKTKPPIENNETIIKKI
jgi:hypothetical protein